jgi:hypothetical protein
MISPGIYIRKELDFLVNELSEKLEGLNRKEEVGISPPGNNGFRGRVIVDLSDREDGWCHVEVNGDAQAVSIVTDFLTVHKSFEDVLVWNCNDERKEYNYTLLKKGKVLEQFSVMGATLDSVSYISELRTVQLQDLINGYDFALDALRRFGVCPEVEKGTGSSKTRLEFALPPRRSIWQSLFGSLSGRE